MSPLGAGPAPLGDGEPLTPHKAATLVATLELSRRLVRDETPRRPLLDCPELVVPYIAAHHRSPDQRVYGAVFLDPCCRMITATEIVRGCQSGAVIDPATVFRQALKTSATSILVFQTRTNGNVVPSAEDWEFTIYSYGCLQLWMPGT